MRLLITGAGGLLGAYLLRELRERNDIVAWGSLRGGERFGFRLRPIDLADANAVANAFREDRPDVILHTAALSRIADCWHDPIRARDVNVGSTATLARLADDAGVKIVFVSTDLVFDGEHAPYREDDAPSPVSVYARTKHEAEEAALAAPGAAVVRVSLLYGPSLHDKQTFFNEQATALRAGGPIMLFRDEWRTPLDLITAARALLAVAESGFSGLLHVGGPERLSRLEMGSRLAAFFGVNPTGIVATDRAAVSGPEPRPRDVSLDSSRWRAAFPNVQWPQWEEAMRELPPIV